MTTKDFILSRTRVLEVLHYEGISGIFTWKQRPLFHFKTTRACNAWNARFAGEEAGCIDTLGYRRISIDGRRYWAHRLAILCFYGAFPEYEVDHVSGKRDNNAIWNIRCVTRAGNGKNMAMRSDNTTGVMGVGWHRSRQKWCVQISVDGKKTHLGYFSDFFEAICCRKSAERRFLYFDGHGREA